MAETWWDRHAIAQLDLFRSWIGDHTAPSKIAARQHVITRGYRSVLDAGCGTCSEYDGYQQDAPLVTYYGVDSCSDLVDLARRRGIANVTHGDLEALPYDDDFVDVVYVRHVLEHLVSYEGALREAVRVARREVLVNWFLRCTDDPDQLSYDPALDLRHNRYNRPTLESFLRSLPKVHGLTWSECGNPDEEFLHIQVHTESAP